ncbi:FAD-dependent oxidoreductase [Peredibacter starrii]|uniref:FAD-dependent oxidoreductase n=1 Tax=Peredibacter starrii TaxID=28202 RepID=A0AAX4HKU7_9BACT|nr:FAD-dependent oxidoreductase [Peredibacter starrii]WPU63866.1 FAD-dependent oxidoreductase [Peredibacter starrii]
MNRREFFLSSLAATSLMMLPPWARAGEKSLMGTFGMDATLQDLAPLQRVPNFAGSTEIEGDLFDEAHEVFWAKDSYISKKGGIPAVSAQFDVVIIGGGISGLAAAYYLAGKKILIIDGHTRFGGNAKTQLFGRNNYVSQGAAYITMPEQGDEIDTFLNSLKIKNLFRKVEHEAEAVNMNGRFINGFWDGATDPARADEFRFAHKKFMDVYENNYPELPIWDPSAAGRNRFNALDGIPFTKWIEAELGNVHPHIMEYISMYCWSSFGASPEEISAAQGLNFLSCDLAGTLVLPGGNGIIADAVFQNLTKRNNVTFLNHAFAVDVRSEGGKAVVCFKNGMNQLQTVSAKQCIVTAPKMVSKKIVNGMDPMQEKAMNSMHYRAYLVGNIFLKKKIPSIGYDIFTMNGQVPTSEYQDSMKRVFADVVFSDWAVKDMTDKSVLTLYMPLPYEMAQQFLFNPDLYNKYLERVKTRIAPMLPGMGLTWNDVAGMRLVRYGHALPVAHINGVRNGMFETAHRSIDNCIHFSNQDNWGNPCFETSFGSTLGVLRRIM